MKRFFSLPLCLLLFIVVEVSGQNLFEQKELSIRDTRKFGLALNLGWNGLSGIGPMIMYYASPHFAIDAGTGISGVGWKFGARGRYLFLKKNFTPFVGAGLLYGTGTGSALISIETDGNKTSFQIKSSPFLQLTAGGDVLATGGFSFLFNLGYVILLKENIQIIGGVPNEDQKRAMDAAYGSGIVIEIGIGYTFKNRK